MNIGIGVSTGSNVASRAENEARQKEDRFSERASSIKTGLGAIPGIAQGASGAIGEVVQQANNVNSTGNLSQVLEEATTGGLLTPEETKLIGNQMGTPEGNNTAKQLMFNILPSRRADQRAVEFISNYPGDRIIEIKQTQDAGKRQQLVNNLVRDIQLDAAGSEDEATMKAIMNRVNGMFGIKGGERKSGALSLDERKDLDDYQTANRLKRAKAGVGIYGEKKDIQEKSAIKVKEFGSDLDLYEKATGEASKQATSASSIQNLRNNWVANWSNPQTGDIDLVGFTPKYISDMGSLTLSVNIKEGTPEYEEFQNAKIQQGEFFGFLNQYIKDLSGAAVTSSEAKRVLRQFGLEEFTEGIIPQDATTSFDINEMIKKAAVQDASKFTPDRILMALNTLGDEINNRKSKIRDTYKSAIADEEKSTQLDDVFHHSNIQKFPSSTKYSADEYSAIEAEQVGKAGSSLTKKALGGVGEALNEMATGLFPGKNKPNPNKTASDDEWGDDSEWEDN